MFYKVHPTIIFTKKNILVLPTTKLFYYNLLFAPDLETYILMVSTLVFVLLYKIILSRLAHIIFLWSKNFCTKIFHGSRKFFTSNKFYTNQDFSLINKLSTGNIFSISKDVSLISEIFQRQIFFLDQGNFP